MKGFEPFPWTWKARTVPISVEITVIYEDEEWVKLTNLKYI